MNKRTMAVMCIAFLLPFSLFSAKKDSAATVLQPYHRNVIKFNPTPMILWDWRNVTFSYERILSPRQSVSVELGYLVMPKLVEDTIADLINIYSRNKQGMNISLEYRFYITQLNTRPTPAGLYLAPYLTFYGYQFKNNFDIIHSSLDSTGTITGRYWAFNLGVELGYQFVFWKRMTVDLILLGPSLSYYGGTTEISGNLSSAENQKIYEELFDRLNSKFPVTKYLSLNETYKQTGKLDIVRLGFRYVVQIGILF